MTKTAAVIAALTLTLAGCGGDTIAGCKTAVRAHIADGTIGTTGQLTECDDLTNDERLAILREVMADIPLLPAPPS